MMKWIRKALQRPTVAATVISLVVLAGVLALRAKGLLQQGELYFYDQLVKLHSNKTDTDSRIVLVGMTEDDLVKYGYPLNDRDLAKVILGLDALEPCVIGLDLYRDLPEPRTKEYYPELEAAFKKVTRLMSIERLGYFKAPPALAEEPDRIVANNLPRDKVDGYFRRGTLIFDKSEPSLSMGMVVRYLIEHEIPYDFDGTTVTLGKTVIRPLTPDAGGYVDLKIDDNDFLASYEAPRSYRINHQQAAGLKENAKDVSYDWSFGDVIEGRIPKDALRGKIVLAATVMESIKDSNPTPIDDNLRGVHMHAMLIHQLLKAAIDGIPPMSWWPEWAEILWIAGFTFAGGGLSLALRSPWKLAPALLVWLGLLGVMAWRAHEAGLWLLWFAPLLGCFIAATFVTSFTAYLEGFERDTMKHIFARHVSSDVVDTLWEARDEFLEGGRLKPMRLTCTVLFTDLKGFSTISEGMEPADLMNWMNEYMNAVARHVDLCGGVVNSYIGDAIMALFGAPAPSTKEEDIDQDAINAVTCALAMRAEMKKLNEGWTERGMPNVAMRCGIYTGPLVAGSLGSADRLMFTVLGDTTNTAARLEAAGKEVEVNEHTKLCTILIGEATLNRLHGKFVTEYVGPMNLKGKANQITVHSVLYAASTPVDNGGTTSDNSTLVPAEK